MTTAKICGLTTPEAVDAAVGGGASHLGFVLFPKSPRHLAVERAAALAKRVAGRSSTVVLLVDPDDALVETAIREIAPDLIQLHGTEPPDRVAAVRRLSGRPVVKALGLSTVAGLHAVAAYEAVADHLLLDASAPEGSDRPGGHGAAFDWSILTGARPARPWFLAGGLTPFTVAAAIAATGAPLVDVSSGVESAPGVKDPTLIAAFLDAVATADSSR